MPSWSTVKSAWKERLTMAASADLLQRGQAGTADAEGDITAYYSLAGDCISDTGSALKQLELSGLRGRGGAGFPFHVKVRSSRDAEAGQKYIVCNADEGDPGAFSDKWLLEERPHSVLFGMLMTGLITGADTGVVYIRGEYPLAVRKLPGGSRSA